MLLMDAAEGGLVENISGVPKACSFTLAQEGGRGSQTKVVGVVIGEMGEKVAGESVFEQHHVCASAFATAAPRSRTTRGSSAQSASQQERLGFHTFRRGDRVRYTALVEGEAEYSAVVFGLIAPAKKENEQSRK
eukprot:6173522-Pleurochrysis_carterae.AAC.1